jgi:hypothetical protein
MRLYFFIRLKKGDYMAKNEKRWFFSPYSAPKPKVPELLKIEVKQVCDELVESVLKPINIDPDPQEERFNYIVDIYTKWYRNYLNFTQNTILPDPML